jgi:hypothetical protein
LIGGSVCSPQAQQERISAQSGKERKRDRKGRPAAKQRERFRKIDAYFEKILYLVECNRFLPLFRLEGYADETNN